MEAMVAEWKVFEDRELGIRFRYPPSEQVEMRQDKGFMYVPIFHWQTNEIGMKVQTPFLSLFVTHDQESQRYVRGERADVEEWIRMLPMARLIGGRVRAVDSLAFKNWEYVWRIQWEPLPDDWYRPIQTVVLVKDSLVVWVNLGDLKQGGEADDALWPQQMAFLKTIEPVE